MEVSPKDNTNNSAVSGVETSAGNNHHSALTSKSSPEQSKDGKQLVACEAENPGSEPMEHTQCPDETMTSEELKPIEGSKSDKDVNSSNNVSAVQDEYSYIKRDEFTSEIFKIEIQNLPRFGFSELKKKLVNLELHPIKVKGFPHKGFAFVTFRDEQAREKALTTLNGFQWKGHSVTAKKSQPTADPLVLKRKSLGLSGDEPNTKKIKETEEICDANEGLSPDERVRKAVMPLFDLPYDEQLKQKAEDIKNIMVRWTKELQHNCPQLRKWVSDQKQLHSESVCEILAIQPSPLLTGYRNKSEFTIGTNHEKSERIVGFRLGSYRDGSSAVGEPCLCDILPEAMKKVAKVFQEYVRQSKYTVYDAQTHEGYWRQLTVRTSTRGDVMAIIEFHSVDLSNEDIEAEKESLRTFFSEAEGKICGVTSLFFNCITNKQSSCRQAANYAHLMGHEWITEDLLGLSFQISPDAFFQINNPATALLYSLVASWCQLDKDSVVLDICCGTGTIGLTLAKHVKRVLGVELCSAAIDDAKKNASLNDVKNIEFHCSKAEDASEKMRNWSKGQKAVAIVDPPRPGLQSKVMYALRRCHFIHRVIYISCNPVAAIQNFTDLMRPKSRRNKGEAFFAVKAVPVDLFPHTKHCELVVMFERKEETESVGEPGKVVKPQKVSEPGKVVKPQKISEPGKVVKPQKLSEPGKVVKPQKLSEPEKVCKPEKVSEPQKVGEPEKVCKPEKVSEPQKVCKPEKVGELKKVGEPGKVCKPEKVSEPEKVCKPEKVGEPGKVCKPEKVGEPDNIDREVPMQS